MTAKLKPNYIFFHLRNPAATIESFYSKGWYSYFDNQKHFQSPSIDISDSQYRSFSRIIPKNEYLEEWLKLSRIGKITWFWSTINKSIYEGFKKVENVEKIFIQLEEVNQNYKIYEKLSEKFSFENKMTKNQFYNVINKASNKDTNKIYEYKNWTDLEKKEFEKIISNTFPHFDKIKTNL